MLKSEISKLPSRNSNQRTSEYKSEELVLKETCSVGASCTEVQNVLAHRSDLILLWVYSVPDIKS
jgi:hypothetical protein